MTEPSRKTCEMVDERDEQCCVRCGVSLWAKIGARHHRKPRSHCSGKEKHLAGNLIDICEQCHRHVHAHPCESYETGFLVHSEAIAEEIPIKTYRHGWIQLNDDGSYQEVTHE